MKLLDEATFTLISEEVVKECREKDVDGVFAMMSANTADWGLYWRLVRRVGPIDQASDGNRYNLMAIAFSKLSFVMAHHRNSGGETNIIGELPYAGGRLSEDREVIYAFSGAAEEVDDEICKAAEEFHKMLPSELRR
ncbi:MAG: hypothetical protein HY505_01925 [Candidatus Yanofskybacteria bacterium]|nr:hypothetical protein [Candidatus Yanofskybacteria bacterium]